MLLTRRYADAARLLQRALATPDLSKEAQGTYYQMLGFSQQLAGEPEATRRTYQKAIVVLRQVPESPGPLDILALAQAGLGNKDAALASARRAIALLPASRDAYEGPIGEYFLAVVQAQAGEKARAIAMLRRLLAMPPGSLVSGLFLTPALLRLNPV